MLVGSDLKMIHHERRLLRMIEFLVSKQSVLVSSVPRCMAQSLDKKLCNRSKSLIS